MYARSTKRTVKALKFGATTSMPTFSTNAKPVAACSAYRNAP
jgi:hypothetical protein